MHRSLFIFVNLCTQRITKKRFNFPVVPQHIIQTFQPSFCSQMSTNAPFLKRAIVIRMQTVLTQEVLTFVVVRKGSSEMANGAKVL